MALSNATKAVWKNPKTGKYYAVDGEGENAKLITVFVKDAVWEEAPTNYDAKGKVYKILDCKAHTTKKGFEVYQVK